jgi:hypothetical protein
MVPKRTSSYQLYLVRCWEEYSGGAGVSVKHYSLEDPRTGQRRDFSSLEALLIALQTNLEQEARQPAWTMSHLSS